MHSKEFFDEPETFNPDRYVASEFGCKYGADVTGYRHDLIFGSGRVRTACYLKLLPC